MERETAVETEPVERAIRERAPAPDPMATVLTAEEYTLFAQVGQSRRVRTGERLFLRGDTGATMYVIAQGTVLLDFGDDLTTKRLGACEFFGELGLLIGDHERSAAAVATCDGELLELRHAEFQTLVERNPACVSQFLRRTILRVVQSEQSLIRRLRLRNQDLQDALDSLRTTTHQLDQIESLTRTDELTGLCNRRGFSGHLEQLRNNDALQGLGLLLIDCDHFKRVNDEHGHLAGDRVLQGLANILRSAIGPDEVACRLGGDEFSLLLKAEDREAVIRHADYVVATAHALQQMQQSPPLMCSLSIGACMIDADGDWSDWYAKADGALYRAKRRGGNRVEWRDSETVIA